MTLLIASNKVRCTCHETHMMNRPRGYKIVSCSTKLSTKFILLINVKMPTIVGILTFISMIDTTSERLKARNFFICQYFNFYEQLKFRAQLSEHETSFITSGQASLPHSSYAPASLYMAKIICIEMSTVFSN